MGLAQTLSTFEEPTLNRNPLGSTEGRVFLLMGMRLEQKMPLPHLGWNIASPSR